MSCGTGVCTRKNVPSRQCELYGAWWGSVSAQFSKQLSQEVLSPIRLMLGQQYNANKWLHVYCIVQLYQPSLLFQAVDMSVWIDEEYDANITFDFSGPLMCPLNVICIKFIQKEDAVKFDGLLTEYHEIHTATLEDHHTFFFEFGTERTTIEATETAAGTDSGVIIGNVTTAGKKWSGPSVLFILLTALLEVVLL